MRGADLLVKTLANAGISRIYSLSGNQIMPIYDACLDAGIEIIHTRHEAAAVYMAEADAQLSGNVAVAMVTAGVGAANALGPLFTSRASDTPVLLLTGDAPRSQDGRGAFQELDQVPMSAPLTKHSSRPQSANDLGNDVVNAIRIATSGRPGPVHLALPFDIVEADASAGSVPVAHECAADPDGPDTDAIQTIIHRLASARRPLVICGPVLSQTRQGGTAKGLSEALDAPVIIMESPRGLKDPALGNIANIFANTDLIVSLGKPVDFTLGFGEPALFDADCKWIVVNAEADECTRAMSNLEGRLEFALKANPITIANTLIESDAGSRERNDWRTKVKEEISARSFSPDDTSASGAITPAQLCAAVQRQIESAGETVVVCDGGEFGQWAQAVTSGTYRVINGVSGAIGGGIGYGIGAKKAKPEATVFALMGDGTAGFHLSEFETAVRADTPFIAIIGNDRKWNAEHQIQLRDYGAERLIGCELSNARYDLAVEALGGHGEYVTEPAELDAALARAVKSGRVACVNVMIEGLAAPSGSSH